ncbi:MAG: type III ribulose-bisphosphate carboxylase [Nanoarchaeota archaeon]|nr:type III ribulose-bisphosphate carboxylase [Nanoarchaeota archaeon]MBU4299600.1 type III ribulose-bisphosphate carboxylase [Nanoarchaeota archaeon]MBU4451378.1 type III ribulose-bisphosphate carboxylase [Nanoarchaeota archaeon]MCG2723419.1 type III ribulose-bisphosphate carboxylase [archaeon]
MKYADYVNSKYKIKESDLVCTFFVEPNGVSMKEAAGGVAAESSIGTWTDISTSKKYVERLSAKVFSIKGGVVKIAYPDELFEGGNIPNILSSVAGNVFGMKIVKNLKLLDIEFPDGLISSFKGPAYGIEGIRKTLAVRKRPLIGTIVKPKIGLNSQDHAKVAYDAWVGGCDVVKDDENLSSQKFNEFETRLSKTLEARDKAEIRANEKKCYLVNVTAETKEMLRRAQLVQDAGGEYAMVDVLTVGWSGLQTLRNENFKLILHGHRAGHAAITKNPKHGISMKVLAKFSRLAGIDQLHVGAAVGKMFEEKEEVLSNCDALTSKMDELKKALPVASGGLSPLQIPDIIKIFGIDVVIQAGGGVHGHPKGTVAGARAMRQAVEASLREITLEEYAKTHVELKDAIKKWK